MVGHTDAHSRDIVGAVLCQIGVVNPCGKHALFKRRNVQLFNKLAVLIRLKAENNAFVAPVADILAVQTVCGIGVHTVFLH